LGSFGEAFWDSFDWKFILAGLGSIDPQNHNNSQETIQNTIKIIIQNKYFFEICINLEMIEFFTRGMYEGFFLK
jgi:hypothetical protein